MDFNFIGWCNKDGHDKVWTIFTVDDVQYVAWGKRGAKLQFKNHGKVNFGVMNANVYKLMRSKLAKGYQEVDAFKLFVLFPDFEDKVSQELLVGVLSGKIK